jgi:acyl-CoA ligase (AMP-forming) (exosortase A-associated)
MTQIPTSSGTEPTRIEEALFGRAKDSSSKVAVVDGTKTFDYETLAAWVRAFALELHRRGVLRGDRVAIFLDKTVESVVALYGVWAAGAIAVPVFHRLKSKQIEHIVTHSSSRFIVVMNREHDQLTAEALSGASVLEIRPPDGAGQDPIPARGGAEEPAAILYTSGSTGRPKGITLSHGNLCAGARIVSTYLGIRETERVISILPFTFDYGLNQLLTTVRCGATLVLHRSLLSADICRSLVKNEITAMAGVPPLWMQLLQSDSPFSGMRFPSLRYMTNSGGALPIEVVSKYREIVPHTQIFLMYGLTEAFRSTYLPPSEIDARPGSMGKAIPECEILVVTEDGRRCEAGEVGELVHRGPTVALNYWCDEEATRAKFRPDPFAPAGSSGRVVYSGDLVKTDADGYLYFVGRRDEQIKSQGYRISPGEVEELIFNSGLVREVVVKGRPDPLSGAVVVAHCVPKDPVFSVETLLEYCRKEMPTYMVPKAVLVHPEFPRTPSGKIDRKAVAA